MSRRLCFVLTSLVIAAQLLAADGSLEVSGPTGTRRLSSADIAALPRATVTISDHGAPATFEGTNIANVLALVGAPSGDKLRGSELTKYVLVEAADSYRAIFALPEVDKAFSDRIVLLADRRDGKALPQAEGPFRIVVENEKKQARCVRQVTRISVGNAK